MKVSNFLFHQVNSTRNQLWDPMDPRLFEKSIRFIKDKFEIIPISDLDQTTEYKSKHKYATISFDDGYKDNFEVAAPILDSLNVKATFFVVTDSIEHNKVTWTHELEHRFEHTEQKQIDLQFEFLPENLRTTNLPTQSERIDYCRKLLPFLKKIDDASRESLLSLVSSTYSDVELPNIMMSWNQLRALKTAGHQIGSHSRTHKMLGTIGSADAISSELITSKQALNKKLNQTTNCIAYPVGSYNAMVKELAEASGYKLGMAVNQMIYDSDVHDLYEVPRIELYNEPWIKTRARITNQLENLKKMIGYR